MWGFTFCFNGNISLLLEKRPQGRLIVSLGKLSQKDEGERVLYFSKNRFWKSKIFFVKGNLREIWQLLQHVDAWIWSYPPLLFFIKIIEATYFMNKTDNTYEAAMCSRFSMEGYTDQDVNWSLLFNGFVKWWKIQINHSLHVKMIIYEMLALLHCGGTFGVMWPLQEYSLNLLYVKSLDFVDLLLYK